jgi:putative MFS transporter
VKARLIIGIATLFDAMDGLTIAYVMPVILVLFKLTPAQVGLLISTGYIGQLVGALFFGWLAERIGRLRAIQLTIVVYSVMSILCMFSWDFASLFAFRTIQGLGLGGEVPLAAAYINEWGKAKGRGRYFLLYELVFLVGLLSAAGLGAWVVPTFGWQYMFLIGAIPALLAVFLRRALPESPRWLANAGRMQEAEAVLSKVESIVSEGGKVALPAPKEAPSGLTKKTSVGELFSGIYRKRTLVVWVMWFTSYLAVNSIQTWVPTLYSTVFKLPLALSLQYGVVSQFAGIAGGFAVAMLIDITGRKRWFTMAFTLSAIGQIALWYFGVQGSLTLLTFISLLWFSWFFFQSITLAVYVYTPEIYPTRMRALGTSISTAWLRAASAIGPSMVAFVLTGYGLPWICLILGAVLLFGALITAVFGIETKGRVLEELSP